MTEVIRISWIFAVIKTTQKVNGLLYYLRKLPLIGKKIPGTVFKSYGLKKILTVLLFIWKAVMTLGAKFLWLGLSYGVAFFVIRFFSGGSFVMLPLDSSILKQGLLFWIVWMSIISVFNGMWYSLDENEVNFLEQFSLPRHRFVRGRLLLLTMVETLKYWPAFFIYGLLLRNPLAVIVVGSLGYLLPSLFFYWLGRKTYTWTISKRRWVSWTVVFILLCFIGVDFWLDPAAVIASAILHPVSWIPLLTVTIFCGDKFLCFPDEGGYLIWQVEQVRKLGTTEPSAKNAQYLGQGLSMQKKLELEADSDETLSGSQYLNDLLFKRYRRILQRSLLIRLAVIGVVWLVVVVVSLLGIFKNATEAGLSGLLPVLFFMMYLASFGKTIVQMVFVNCDMAMLYYPFYREASTILAGFFYRFRKTLFYNGSIILGILLIFTTFTLLNPGVLSLRFFAVLLLLLFSLAVLFSFHELFIYYVLQPFTSELEVTNPLYKIVSGIFYGISYMNLQLDVTGLSYALLVSALSLVYIAIGLFILWKKAPQTFRMKE